jgi:hypothetical protein
VDKKVFLVGWETQGCIPVVAASQEEAKKLAAGDWHRNFSCYTEDDVYFGTPKQIQCLEQAYIEDETIEEVGGDCKVVGSNQALKDLLPSDPTYYDKLRARFKKK